MTDNVTAEPAARLREARIGAGFESAASAARANGWADGAYRHHENGTRNMPPKVAAAYAKAYGVSIGWLLGDGPQRSYAEELQGSMYTDREIEGANEYSNRAKAAFGAVMVPIADLSQVGRDEIDAWEDDRVASDTSFFAIDESLLEAVAPGRSSTPFTFMVIRIDTPTGNHAFSEGDVLIVDRAASQFRRQGALMLYVYSGFPSVHTIFRHPDDTYELLGVGDAGSSIRVARNDVAIWGQVIWAIKRT
ncbi:hypothetical protein [uncultured Sphingomonas sp.]|uniref:hypothetical protein n=1 Tax=uncultured Sphingomonas sp. TaxID=158754 RepID=UPI00259AC4D4|nr:hypothetical protein [uncultured Sphingomonas sp.]